MGSQRVLKVNTFSSLSLFGSSSESSKRSILHHHHSHFHRNSFYRLGRSKRFGVPGRGGGFCCFKSYLETPEWARIMRPCFLVISTGNEASGVREPVQLEVISSHPKSTEMGGGKLEKDAFSGKNVARKCKLGEENVEFRFRKHAEATEPGRHVEALSKRMNKYNSASNTC